MRGAHFEAALADDLSGIAVIVASTPAATAQRMAEDIFVAELTHMLHRDDTPLHLAAAGLRYGAALCAARRRCPRQRGRPARRDGPALRL